MDVLQTPVLASFGTGIALGGAPGPVQAVLLNESTQGVGRGLRAMAGANLTFGLLLLVVAAGFSQIAISATGRKWLSLAGGAMLLWLAADGLRSSYRPLPHERRRLSARFPAFVRGAAVVLLNPGGWLFLATVAASLFTAARLAGGRPLAVAAAVAMSTGLALGDATIVVLGGLGLRRAGATLRLWFQRALACGLGGLGLWLVIVAVKPL